MYDALILASEQECAKHKIIKLQLKGGFIMKKKSALFLTILLCLTTMLAGCTSDKSEVSSTSDEVAKANNTSKEYLKIKGYDEYIATGNTGYEDISYFNIKNDIPNEKAYEYYKKNRRVIGNYTITDYENGVCLNKINKTPEEDSEIKIPEMIDGKPVVKIGSFVRDESAKFDDIVLCNPFNQARNCKVILPSTVKYISSEALLSPTFMVEDEDRDIYAYIDSFEADKNNPYYSSYNKNLYSKDYSKLLYLYDDSYISDITLESEEYNASDGIASDGYYKPLKVFEPANGISDSNDIVVFDCSNLEKINTFVDHGESGRIYGNSKIDDKDYWDNYFEAFEDDDDVLHGTVIKGYKDNTALRQWAKNCHLVFVAYDNY